MTTYGYEDKTIKWKLEFYVELNNDNYDYDDDDNSNNNNNEL